MRNSFDNSACTNFSINVAVEVWDVVLLILGLGLEGAEGVSGVSSGKFKET